MRLIDHFYELLAYTPFSKHMANENSTRNLAILSYLITIFQNYYQQLDLVTEDNKAQIPRNLFFSFLNFLLHYVIDDYEDPNNPIRKGYVRIMTVHQSKGLEFPIVIAGSLGDTIWSQRHIDRELCQYYHRQLFEPENRIAEFDKMRQYYVAFSRAEKLLVLTHGNITVKRR